jgi:hypothetical protein
MAAPPSARWLAWIVMDPLKEYVALMLPNRHLEKKLVSPGRGSLFGGKVLSGSVFYWPTRGCTQQGKRCGFRVGTQKVLGCCAMPRGIKRGGIEFAVLRINDQEKEGM